MAEELSNMWKNLSLKLKEAKEIVIENALCSKDRKNRKSLSSWESSEGSGSGHGHDLLEYAANMKTDWASDIQRVRYELVSHVVRYDWV